MNTAVAKTPAAALAEVKAQPAPVAPATTEAKTTAPKAPKVATDRKVLGGPGYDRLSAAGASIVILPSKGRVHEMLSKTGKSVIAIGDLGKAIDKHRWDKFDRGYLVGPAASYSACAVTSSSKKAKAQPAFVFATPGDGLKKVTLYTADGQVWERPAKGEREQGVYDSALKAATAALEA